MVLSYFLSYPPAPEIFHTVYFSDPSENDQFQSEDWVGGGHHDHISLPSVSLPSQPFLTQWLTTSPLSHLIDIGHCDSDQKSTPLENKLSLIMT